MEKRVESINCEIRKSNGNLFKPVSVCKAALMHKKKNACLWRFGCFSRSTEEKSTTLLCLLLHTAPHPVLKSLSRFSVLRDRNAAKHGRKTLWKSLHLRDCLSLDIENIFNGRSRRLSADMKLGLRLKQEPGGIHYVWRASGAGCKAAFVLLNIHRPSSMRCHESLKCCNVSIWLCLCIISMYWYL